MKYFVVIQIKIIQNPPSATLKMCILAPALKSPFYSDFSLRLTVSVIYMVAGFGDVITPYQYLESCARRSGVVCL